MRMLKPARQHMRDLRGWLEVVQCHQMYMEDILEFMGELMFI